VAYRQFACFCNLLEGNIAVQTSLQKLCCSSHLQRRESASKWWSRYSHTAIKADKMTVQGMQHMVQENLRSVKGLVKRRDEGLPEVVYDRIEMPKRPNQCIRQSNRIC
jgi:hypothetical protein